MCLLDIGADIPALGRRTRGIRTQPLRIWTTGPAEKGDKRYSF